MAGCDGIEERVNIELREIQETDFKTEGLREDAQPSEVTVGHRYLELIQSCGRDRLEPNQAIISENCSENANLRNAYIDDAKGDLYVTVGTNSGEKFFYARVPTRLNYFEMRDEIGTEGGVQRKYLEEGIEGLNLGELITLLEETDSIRIKTLVYGEIKDNPQNFPASLVLQARYHFAKIDDGEFGWAVKVLVREVVRDKNLTSTQKINFLRHEIRTSMKDLVPVEFIGTFEGALLFLLQDEQTLSEERFELAWYLAKSGMVYQRECLRDLLKDPKIDVALRERELIRFVEEYSVYGPEDEALVSDLVARDELSDPTLYWLTFSTLWLNREERLAFAREKFDDENTEPASRIRFGYKIYGEHQKYRPEGMDALLRVSEETLFDSDASEEAKVEAAFVMVELHHDDELKRLAMEGLIAIYEDLPLADVENRLWRTKHIVSQTDDPELKKRALRLVADELPFVETISEIQVAYEFLADQTDDKEVLGLARGNVIDWIANIDYVDLSPFSISDILDVAEEVYRSADDAAEKEAVILALSSSLVCRSKDFYSMQQLGLDETACFIYGNTTSKALRAAVVERFVDIYSFRDPDRLISALRTSHTTDEQEVALAEDLLKRFKAVLYYKTDKTRGLIDSLRSFIENNQPRTPETSLTLTAK